MGEVVLFALIGSSALPLGALIAIVAPPRPGVTLDGIPENLAMGVGSRRPDRRCEIAFVVARATSSAISQVRVYSLPMHGDCSNLPFVDEHRRLTETPRILACAAGTASPHPSPPAASW